MKKTIIIFFFLSGFLKSQNLVPNWSFETYTLCPNSGGQINSAVPWVGQSTNSSDYFNACSTNALNVPYAASGFQYAKNGNGFAGIWTMDPPGSDYREYIQVAMIDTFTAYKCYFVEFYTNLNNDVRWATNNIAANFSKLQWSNTGTGFVLTLPQHITNYNNPIIKDTLNWTKVSGIYVAGGGEKYLTIGNFKNDVLTDTSKINPFANGAGAYYYFDAVSVYSLNPSGPFPWSYPSATINSGDSVYIGNTMGGSFNSNWYTLPGPTFVKNAPGFYSKPVITTTYIVTYTICGVANSNTLTVTVNGGAGVKEWEVLNSEFVVSPNPNNGLVQIEILNNEFAIENLEIKIVTILGQEMKKEKLNSKKQLFDLSELPNGIYFLELQQKDRVVAVKKIVKQ